MCARLSRKKHYNEETENFNKPSTNLSGQYGIVGKNFLCKDWSKSSSGLLKAKIM